MALEDFPPGWQGTTRQREEQRWLRDYKLRNPAADITTGQPVLDARLRADALMPIHADAELIAAGINEDDARGPQMDRVGGRIGRERGKAKGAVGYVAVQASAGGTTLYKGDELENQTTRLRYEAAETITRQDGEHVRVRAKTTGPGTDVAPGVVLQWVGTRAGCKPNATVVEQSGGRGLSGGSDAETDARYLDGIRARKRNPPAGDNDAELVAVIEKTPDVPVEQVFTYPGIYGGGSTAYTFTVLPVELGASRIPTGTQLELAADWLAAQFPADDSYFPLLIVPDDLVLTYFVTWAIGAWNDDAPWPEYSTDGVAVTAVTSATVFTLDGTGDDPAVGTVIGLWDAAKRKFRRKTVLSFTGTGPWVITCDTSNAASDTTYTPIVDQLVSPWSDNLETVPEAVLTELAKMGPGEIFASPADIPSEGRRRRRAPEGPKTWPYEVPTRVTVALQDRPEILRVINNLGGDAEAAIGIPPYMIELTDLAFFSEGT